MFRLMLSLFAALAVGGAVRSFLWQHASTTSNGVEAVGQETSLGGCCCCAAPVAVRGPGACMRMMNTGAAVVRLAPSATRLDAA